MELEEDKHYFGSQFIMGENSQHQTAGQISPAVRLKGDGTGIQIVFFFLWEVWKPYHLWMVLAFRTGLFSTFNISGNTLKDTLRNVFPR